MGRHVNGILLLLLAGLTPADPSHALSLMAELKSAPNILLPTAQQLREMEDSRTSVFFRPGWKLHPLLPWACWSWTCSGQALGEKWMRFFIDVNSVKLSCKKRYKKEHLFCSPKISRRLWVMVCVCLGVSLHLQQGLYPPSSNLPCTEGPGSLSELFHSPIMSISDLLPSDISALSSGRCNLHLNSTLLPSAGGGEKREGQWVAAGECR